MLAAGLFLSLPALAPADLLVDFTQGGVSGTLQAGYEEFLHNVDGGGLVTKPFNNALGVGNNVDVSVAGNTHWRSFIPATGIFAGQSDLLRDGALCNNVCTMNIGLAGLQDGLYNITMYHHTTQFGPSERALDLFDVQLTDGLVANSLVVAGVAESDNGSPALSTTTVPFSVVGGSPVNIALVRAVSTAGMHVTTAGFDLAAGSPPPPPPPSFKVDLGRNTNGDAPLQPGWEGFNHDGTAAMTRSYANSFGIGDNIDVTVQSPFWRDYPAITSGPFQSQTNLLSDLILINDAAQEMTIRLENLEDGVYQITTYHHITQNSGVADFNIILADASGTNTVHTGLRSTGIDVNPTNPTSISTVDTLFAVSGGNAVTLTFDPTTAGHAGVNAFELTRVIPEPSSFALAGLGLLGLVGFGWRRRVRR